MTNREILLSLQGNLLVESNRYFLVDLFSPTNAAIGVAPGRVQIIDDDYNQISFSSVSAPEGNLGATPLLFNLSVWPPASNTVTVDYQTIRGSATAGSDFLSKAGTLTFLPGVTNQVLGIPIYGDTDHERDEEFRLVLSNPQSAILAVSEQIGTIVNDDPEPDFSMIDQRLTHGVIMRSSRPDSFEGTTDRMTPGRLRRRLRQVSRRG